MRVKGGERERKSEGLGSGGGGGVGERGGFLFEEIDDAGEDSEGVIFAFGGGLFEEGFFEGGEDGEGGGSEEGEDIACLGGGWGVGGVGGPEGEDGEGWVEEAESGEGFGGGDLDSWGGIVEGGEEGGFGWGGEGAEDGAALGGPPADGFGGIGEGLDESGEIGGEPLGGEIGEGEDALDGVSVWGVGLGKAFEGRAFGEEAVIEVGDDALFEGLAEALEICELSGVGGEVVNIVGIVEGIVEFFGRFFAPEHGGGGGELVGLGEARPGLVTSGLEHVMEEGNVGSIGAIVMDVEVAGIGDRADGIEGFVHAIAHREDEGLRGRFGGTGEGVALEIVGDGDPEEREDRGGEVDEVDGIFDAGAWGSGGEVLPFWGVIDD